MKRILMALIVFLGLTQISFSQQIIHTNKKSSCSFVEPSSMQGCVDESLDAIFRFNENIKTFIHTVAGVEVTYNIENRTFASPFWTYRITNADGSYDLKFNQANKEFYFYPTTVLVNGSPVIKYHFQ
jgi:hypothetical protein